VELDLWYRWRERDRLMPAVAHRDATARREEPGVVEQARRKVGRVLVRAGSLIAAERYAPIAR
jgi:hypothetical protein